MSSVYVVSELASAGGNKNFFLATALTLLRYSMALRAENRLRRYKLGKPALSVPLNISDEANRNFNFAESNNFGTI